MRILIIEDEEKLAKSLSQGLNKQGYTADYILDGASGQKRLELYHREYDLAIVDLMLPMRDGFTVCRNLRDLNIMLPLLVLTARQAVDDKVRALDAGADDYLEKPFNFQELLARLRALLRRPEQALPTELQLKELILNPSTRKAFVSGQEIMLTLKEFNILEYLMRHPNQVLTREQIYDNLWDFNSNALSNIIDVHIRNLRKKLEPNKHGQILKTVRGVGYQIKV